MSGRIALTVLICTHNRARLLERTLRFLNECQRPDGVELQLVVAANACTDATHELLEAYARAPDGRIALRWMTVPRPGKSHALNASLQSVAGDRWIAFVDDDHRVDQRYLLEIAGAIRAHPSATMLCGRILPDWTGAEPAWVHSPLPFAVYPLPVPHYEQGAEPREITLERGPLPGGGNLVMHAAVFVRTGEFSADLGPRGHDLGGGEDSDFVRRSLLNGERLVYVPAIVQFHYVDLERLTVSYIVRKAYQRSRASTLVHAEAVTGVPRFLYRKLLGHAWAALSSLYWPETRFNLVRMAATLGEIDGYAAAARRNRGR